MNEKITKCPICQKQSTSYQDYQNDKVYYICPTCGHYELGREDIININHLASYLLYHKHIDSSYPTKYHTTLNKETCDKYKSEYDNSNSINRLPVHMDSNMIDSWYPKTISERVDKILLYLYSKSSHIGQHIYLNQEETFSMLFIDRFEINRNTNYQIGNPRSTSECIDESDYMLKFLSELGFIEFIWGSTDENALFLTILPKGYSRIDEIQKNTSNGRNVLVAMQFGDITKKLREAIRQGISDAGYNPIFIDEVQHNELITPELLKHIRDSKFVVVDLTHQNNGAYFEEGYAMGLGKPVIQLCNKDTKLHFDIAQKNTIMWEKEEEIPLRLTNRIKATID